MKWSQAVGLLVPLTVFALGMAGTAPAFSAEYSLYCRAQIVMSCKERCTARENLPIDVSLDFANKTGSYCRGTRCDDGKLEISERNGQWDSAPCRIFVLSDGFAALAEKLV